MVGSFSTWQYLWVVWDVVLNLYMLAYNNSFTTTCTIFLPCQAAGSNPNTSHPSTFWRGRNNGISILGIIVLQFKFPNSFHLEGVLLSVELFKLYSLVIQYGNSLKLLELMEYLRYYLEFHSVKGLHLIVTLQCGAPRP